jgi:hypothetical protein
LLKRTFHVITKDSKQVDVQSWRSRGTATSTKQREAVKEPERQGGECGIALVA